LTGPRCAYYSTIEIAYPMREVERSDTRVTLRVVIPEASWWEPATPYLYQGDVELWDNGTLCERQRAIHGIATLQITTKGLRLNGSSYQLRGKMVQPTIRDAELKLLHDAGVNAVMTSFRTEREWTSNIGLWALADRYGLFVLCAADSEYDTFQFAAIQSMSVCAFAYVPRWGDGEQNRIIQFMADHREWRKPIFGIEYGQTPIPDLASFILCREADLTALDESAPPRIVLTKTLPETLPIEPKILGWIASESHPQ
jgi:beta-galactosidase/beta-glucuronidase